VRWLLFENLVEAIVEFTYKRILVLIDEIPDLFGVAGASGHAQKQGAGVASYAAGKIIVARFDNPGRAEA
jgi:hypothetical protein